MQKLITVISILLMSITAVQAKHGRDRDRDRGRDRGYVQSDLRQDLRAARRRIDSGRGNIQNNFYGPIISSQRRDRRGARRFNSQTCILPRPIYYREAYVYNSPWRGGSNLLSLIFDF